MSEQQKVEREREFLLACNVDLSNGFFSEDVTYWKKQEPELFQYYMYHY